MLLALPGPVGLIIVQIIRHEIFREVLKAAIIVVIRKKTVESISREGRYYYGCLLSCYLLIL
jgi:hypothetical protein